MNNLTLVAYYGEKSRHLLSVINSCLDTINGSSIAEFFIPYPVTQIHATIIGMEWMTIEGKPVNQNYYQLSAKKNEININSFAQIIDNTFPIEIQIGGFDKEYKGFKSLGKHPYERSFQINKETNKVILIGWPNNYGNFQRRTLEELRATLKKKCHIAHKYKNDNDLYFVLGEVKRPKEITEINFIKSLKRTEKSMRDLLSKNSCNIRLNTENLSLVSYSSTDLNESSSRVYPFQQYYRNIGQLFK